MVLLPIMMVMTRLGGLSSRHCCRQGITIIGSSSGEGVQEVTTSSKARVGAGVVRCASGLGGL